MLLFFSRLREIIKIECGKAPSEIDHNNALRFLRRVNDKDFNRSVIEKHWRKSVAGWIKKNRSYEVNQDRKQSDDFVRSFIESNDYLKPDDIKIGMIVVVTRNEWIEKEYGIPDFDSYIITPSRYQKVYGFEEPGEMYKVNEDFHPKYELVSGVTPEGYNCSHSIFKLRAATPAETITFKKSAFTHKFGEAVEHLNLFKDFMEDAIESNDDRARPVYEGLIKPFDEILEKIKIANLED